jgi:hypothetical protein
MLSATAAFAHLGDLRVDTGERRMGGVFDHRSTASVTHVTRVPGRVSLVVRGGLHRDKLVAAAPKIESRASCASTRW